MPRSRAIAARIRQPHSPLARLATSSCAQSHIETLQGLRADLVQAQLAQLVQHRKPNRSNPGVRTPPPALRFRECAFE